MTILTDDEIIALVRDSKIDVLVMAYRDLRQRLFAEASEAERGFSIGVGDGLVAAAQRATQENVSPIRAYIEGDNLIEEFKILTGPNKGKITKLITRRHG